MSSQTTVENRQEREELLMTELLGELVKVRGLGYKTMRRARVGVREKMRRGSYREGTGGHQFPTGEYVPHLKYEGEARGQNVGTIKRLDVMTPEGWATVWDDGKDDVLLFEGETLSTSAKPTGREYRTGML